MLALMLLSASTVNWILELPGRQPAWWTIDLSWTWPCLLKGLVNCSLLDLTPKGAVILDDGY